MGEKRGGLENEIQDHTGWGQKGFQRGGVRCRNRYRREAKKVHLMHIRKKSIQSKVKATIRIFSWYFFTQRENIFLGDIFLKQRKTLQLRNLDLTEFPLIRSCKQQRKRRGGGGGGGGGEGKTLITPTSLQSHKSYCNAIRRRRQQQRATFLFYFILGNRGE